MSDQAHGKVELTTHPTGITGHRLLCSVSQRETVEPLVEAHPDLYRRLSDGTPAVRIDGGRISIASVVDAPFGLGGPFDPTGFVPLGRWEFESLGIR